MNPIKLAFPIFLILFLTSSCKTTDDDASIEEMEIIECPDKIHLGTVELTQQSLDFLPEFYDESLQSILFTDLSGNEYEATVTSYEQRIVEINSLNEYPCETNPGQTYQHEYSSEKKEIELAIESLNISIHVKLGTLIRLKRFDEEVTASEYYSIYELDLCTIVVFASIPPSSSNTIFNYVSDQKDYPNKENAVPDFETYDIHGESFSNVYFTVPSQEGDFNVQFNSTLGIVGIEQPDEGISLKFDSFQ